jgi:hypothetical protein
MPFDYTHVFSLRAQPADQADTPHNPDDATPAGYHTPPV